MQEKVQPTPITIRLSWSEIIENFTSAYHSVYLQRYAKAYLDYGGHVIEGAKDRWKDVLLIDAIVCHFQDDDFQSKLKHSNASSRPNRRQFDQHKVLRRAVIDCKVYVSQPLLVPVASTTYAADVNFSVLEGLKSTSVDSCGGNTTVSCSSTATTRSATSSSASTTKQLATKSSTVSSNFILENKAYTVTLIDIPTEWLTAAAITKHVLATGATSKSTQRCKECIKEMFSSSRLSHPLTKILLSYATDIVQKDLQSISERNAAAASINVNDEPAAAETTSKIQQDDSASKDTANQVTSSVVAPSAVVTASEPSIAIPVVPPLKPSSPSVATNIFGYAVPPVIQYSKDYKLPKARSLSEGSFSSKANSSNASNKKQKHAPIQHGPPATALPQSGSNQPAGQSTLDQEEQHHNEKPTKRARVASEGSIMHKNSSPPQEPLLPQLLTAVNNSPMNTITSPLTTSSSTVIASTSLQQSKHGNAVDATSSMDTHSTLTSVSTSSGTTASDTTVPAVSWSSALITAAAYLDSRSSNTFNQPTTVYDVQYAPRFTTTSSTKHTPH